MDNKKIIITSVLVSILVVATLTATYAYFKARIGTGSTTNTIVTAKTIDGLTFNQGTNLSIIATQTNFANGKGNLSSNTSPTVTLKARNDASASYNYKACLNITENDFEYTTTRESHNLFDINSVGTDIIASGTAQKIDNGWSVKGNLGNSAEGKNYAHSNGWFKPGSDVGMVYLEAGTQVTVSADVKIIKISDTLTNNKNIKIYLYGSENFYTDTSIVLNDGTTRVSKTYTINTSGNYYPLFTLQNNELEITNIQIEKGSFATDYEAYGLVDAAELELSVSKNDVVVFENDITDKTGEVCIPTTVWGSTTIHTISATSGSTTTDTWNATLTFKNYNNNQNVNLGKTFNSNFVFTRI